MNYQELQQQLYSLLTEKEREEGYVYVKQDPLSSTRVLIGTDDVEYVLRKTPYRDHIIGFKRREYGIDLILDEEGQKKWDAKEADIRKFYGI